MTRRLNALLEYCEAGLAAPARRLRSYERHTTECPRCSATGISVLLRNGLLVTCLVCGLSTARTLPTGCSSIR